MPGYIPLPEITPARNRTRRGFCRDCGKTSVVPLESGIKVCVSCGGYWAPEAPPKPSAEQVFGLYREGRAPSATAIRESLGMSLVSFFHLVNRFLDNGSADEVNTELAATLRERREHRRNLRTVHLAPANRTTSREGKA